MLKKIKSKYAKVLVPLSIILFNANLVFAQDDVERKMNKAKTWTIGLLTTAAAINLLYAIVRAGQAKGQSDIESAEKYRKNAWIAAIGVGMVDIVLGLWNSW